jgi:hypothetical protein
VSFASRKRVYHDIQNDQILSPGQIIVFRQESQKTIDLPRYVGNLQFSFDRTGGQVTITPRNPRLAPPQFHARAASGRYDGPQVRAEQPI